VSARSRALAGSIAFFFLGPLLEAGVGPWLITGGFDRGDGVLDATGWTVAGGALIALGILGVLWCFVAFVRDGIGTPSPLAPTVHLLATGPYAHVRNPMYVATATIILGEGLLIARPLLLLCAALYVAALACLVRWSEEPQLARRFGAPYDAYRRAVPAWRPRLRPWRPAA
jgi:protein-S-isoprenylcysteine O-methyltransferase Ste14